MVEFIECLPFVISGGYNIKTGPGCSIELMKFDMGGSAAVLGAAKAIGQIKPHGVEVSHWFCHYDFSWHWKIFVSMLCLVIFFSSIIVIVTAFFKMFLSFECKCVVSMLSLHMQVHFIVAACENMISGTGMRPGDIVTASNGKTIEV